MATYQLQIQNPHVTAAAATATATATATAADIRAKMMKSASYKETESSSYAAAAAAKALANKTSATENNPMDKSKKRCLCAPTTHAGSFKCRLHRATSTLKPSASSPSIGGDNKQKLSRRKITQCGGVNGRLQLSRFGKAAAAAVELGG